MSLSDPWFVRIKAKKTAQLRLFCFPYAGGGVSAYHTWPDALPPGIDVYAVRLPGRESRLLETPLKHISAVLPPLVQAMQSHLDAPFAFFGHSLGALIAFELAHKLRQRGDPPPLILFASGRRAPQIPNPDPPIHSLPRDEFVQKLRQYDGTPEQVLAHKELMELLLPALQADFAINETYTHSPVPPLDCPITAFGGLEDATVEREGLKAWQSQTHGTFKLHLLPGSHFFIHSASDQLLQTIAQELLSLAGCQDIC